MKANPGGIVAPQEVIGRDLLIEELWDRLSQHSGVKCSFSYVLSHYPKWTFI